MLLLLLALASCGTEPSAQTPSGTDIPATQSTSTPDTSEDTPAEHLRILMIDQNKDGKNDYKIVVDTEAAHSTERVPFRLPDAEDPQEDSFRSVSMYRLSDKGETLVWYTNLCMGSAPRGGVALKDGMVFSYYYDVYEYGEGRKLSISCYEYHGDIYGSNTYHPNLKHGSFVTNEVSDEIWAENFGERHSYELRNAVNVLDEMLDGAEILLDVTGKEPIFSTDEGSFTKQYADRFDYRDIEGSLAEEIQDSYIVK